MNFKKLAVSSALPLALVLGLMLFSNTASAAGTNRYVAPGGVDSGNCSSAGSPCATIRFAVMQSQAGDTVNVASRLAGVAGRGETIVSGTVAAALTGKISELEQREPVMVKGKDEPQNIFAVPALASSSYLP